MKYLTSDNIRQFTHRYSNSDTHRHSCSGVLRHSCSVLAGIPQRLSRSPNTDFSFQTKPKYLCPYRQQLGDDGRSMSRWLFQMLNSQMEKAEELDNAIRKNLEGLGYGE